MPKLSFFKKKLTKFYSKLGPGLITGASDDDPSGIATYSQAGASFGYRFLWGALITFPLMACFQEMCGRIGIVTGNGLASIIKKHYPRWVLYFAVSFLLFANTLNIGANLGAMAASIRLILPLPFWFLLSAVSVIVIYLEVFVSYKKYKHLLKYLTFSLFAYVISFFIVKHDFRILLPNTFIPNITFTKEYFMIMVALLGTTISPYLFFWQTSEEVEELVDAKIINKIGGKIQRIFKRQIFDLRFDTLTGMFFSNLIMYFIIATTAATLHKNGIYNVDTAAEAALALRPIGGELSFILFVLGILGTGLLSIPVLAGSSSYALSETLGLNEGLYNKFNKAKGFYLIIAVSSILGILINLLGVPPFLLLFYSAFINGVITPFLLIIIMFIANNRVIMKNRVNGKVANFFGIITIILMFVSLIAFLYFSL